MCALLTSYKKDIKSFSVWLQSSPNKEGGRGGSRSSKSRVATQPARPRKRGTGADARLGRYEGKGVCFLQALRVPRVGVRAGVRRRAGGGAGPALAAALSPVLSDVGRAAGGGGGGGGGDLGGGLGGGGGRLGGSRGLGGAGAGAAAGRAGGTGEGAVDGTELDVGVDDVGVGGVGLDVAGDTGGGGARAAEVAGAGSVGRVGGVEPEHVGVVVVPERHDEDHTLGEGGAHLHETSLGAEVVGVAEGGLLGVAVGGGDGVAADSGDIALGVGDHLAVLDVESLDLGEVAAAVGEELGDDGELGGGVDGHARAVEGGVALAVAVEVASIGVALASVAGSAVGAAAIVASAHSLADGSAGMRRQGGAHLVRLPDIHLRAAAAVVSETSVLVVGRGSPSIDVGLENSFVREFARRFGRGRSIYLAVDELQVTGALAVAVTGTADQNVRMKNEQFS